ncbi:MAG: hypothetical protein WD824_19875 [Cyclobacteriaceae bacterium]
MKTSWPGYAMGSNLIFYSIFITGLTMLSCVTTPREISNSDQIFFDKASQNADQANEGFIRSDAYMHAWLSYADPESKLVPRTLDRDKDIWNANDCAADNFPFLVLTSFFTNQEMYRGRMREMLDNEIRLTSRVKSLPDTYSFSKKDFLFDTVSMPRIIFGTTEYIKDGLLPITEWLGDTPWSERMLTMLKDMDEYVDVAGGFGDKNFGNAPVDEVNGELLQILSRVYWLTGEKKFLDWAIQIGDHFMLGEGYPLTQSNYLRLRDHGCEVVSGLCELYVTLHYADQKKKLAYKEPLYKLLDYILAHGRNSDGFFFNAINPKTGEVVEPKLADTWGYTLNGYYAVYLVDSVDAYKNAVTAIFENLHKYHNYDWENLGADGYADAIEGALNLYNRVRDERAARWIDREIQVMWSMQDSAHRENAQQWKGSGIIEGWYGDGNFARTTIMHNLWKSKGTYLQPWNAEVKLGGELKGDTLFLTMNSKTGWQGKLFFDKPRHAVAMKLPVDWPRINQFPEWFTVSPHTRYKLVGDDKGTTEEIDGNALLQGLSMALEPNEIKRFMVFRIK